MRDRMQEYRIGSPFTGRLVVYNGDRDYRECAVNRPKRKILSANRRKGFMNMRKYILMHTPWVEESQPIEPYKENNLFELFPNKRKLLGIIPDLKEAA